LSPAASRSQAPCPGRAGSIHEIRWRNRGWRVCRMPSFATVQAGSGFCCGCCCARHLSPENGHFDLAVSDMGQA
jgi:hypothetical protein